MGRIVVLDPTAAPGGENLGPGPDAGSLAGSVLGIRTDRVWRSFEWVIAEWHAALSDAGADVRVWVAGNRIGEEGERTAHALERFAGEVDVAVVGLGN